MVKVLMIVHSVHHQNTYKIAKVMADFYSCPLHSPKDILSDSIKQYDLLGIGSGIYSGTHHEAIIQWAKQLPDGNNMPVFIFSTCGIPGFVVKNPEKNATVKANHDALRQIFNHKGYRVVGNYYSLGYNTNSFLKYFDGINKERPNQKDFERAKKFARQILEKISDLK